MAGGSSLTALLPVGLVVAALGAFYSNPIPILNQFAGRDHEFTIRTDHLNHGPLNNDKCWKNYAGQACEDVRIHHASGVAFLACGFPETRQYFYPPLARHDLSHDVSYHEYFLKYDISKNVTTKLKLEGIDSSYDLVLHGIDIVEPKNDPSKIYIFAVNHPRDGESIVLFEHVLGSDVLKFVRDFRHPAIKTPNAVAATSLSSFFTTNDHYFYGGGLLGGFLRHLEGLYGPWKWGSDVVYCSAASTSSDAKVDCKVVSPKHAQPSANGAVLVDDGKTLLVNDVVEATTTVYDVDPVTKALTVRKKAQLGAGADNLSEIPGGDIAVCIFPDLLGLMTRLGGDNVLNYTLAKDAGIVRLNKAKDYEPELIYWDDGNLITVLTGAAIDPKRGKLLAGGVVERYFIVCDIKL